MGRGDSGGTGGLRWDQWDPGAARVGREHSAGDPEESRGTGETEADRTGQRAADRTGQRAADRTGQRAADRTGQSVADRTEAPQGPGMPFVPPGSLLPSFRCHRRHRRYPRGTGDSSGQTLGGLQ
ncbi:hypothetical protein GCM10010515_35700 [Streptomyces fructofermentans]|uniref:Uncharacterized protein n=1 Tax=Streptomyces fructofermentans TaxID=152141 RepID=A0A918KIX4_9ACTN|nr:hypothetical protein GCM10010515_35700 [Streptomyces fructofermentans]